MPGARRRERAEAQTFWSGFFDVFGIRRATDASFAEPIRNFGGHTDGARWAHQLWRASSWSIPLDFGDPADNGFAKLVAESFA